MAQTQPSFTFEQWKERIANVETMTEFAAFEEMLRTDCQIMLMQGKDFIDITDLTALAREKHKELLKAK